jgi:hypothetical protein
VTASYVRVCLSVGLYVCLSMYVSVGEAGGARDDDMHAGHVHLRHRRRRDVCRPSPGSSSAVASSSAVSAV